MSIQRKFISRQNKIIKSSIIKLRKYNYHQTHKSAALKALNLIEKNTNYILSEKEKSMIKDYSIEIFGSAVYSYWLYVYAAYNQGFIEGWIPDNYFGYIVAPKINKGVGKIANVKTLSKQILNTDLLPDKLYLIDNFLYDTDYNMISTEEAKVLLFNEREEYFLKKDNSAQGKGIIKISENNFDSLDFSRLGDAVIQNGIIQADWFSQINPDSVATIRITTVKGNDGKIRKRASYLRVGMKGNEIIKSEEAFKIPIIDDKGTLGEFGSAPDWKRYSKHPDTGFTFANKIIPNYFEVIEMCERAHQKVPQFTIIGWDVTIDIEGSVKIMEWNARHPGIKFTESATGPNFKDLKWENLW